MIRRFLLTTGLAVGLATWLLPGVAEAGATRSGESFRMSSSFSKRTDVAYDPVNDVYFAVSGDLSDPPRVYGRFVRSDGSLVGGSEFLISARAMMPRVAYSSDLGGFLVVWQDLRVTDKFAQIYGRFIKFQGDGGVNATGDIFIDDALGGAKSQTPPDVVCASGKGECLVAWSQTGAAPDAPNDIHARRVDIQGNLLGPELNITHDVDYEDEVGLGYDPGSGRYLAGWATYREALQVAQIEVASIVAGSGELGARQVIAQHGSSWLPQVEPMPNGVFLVSWFTRDGVTTFGRMINADGTPASGAFPLLRNYGGPRDGFSLAYNPVSNTYFAVAHGGGSEQIGLEIDTQGVPSPEFTVTALGARDGTFNPRIAASSTKAQWLMTTSKDFAFVGGQFITTDRREPRPGGGGEKPPSALITFAAPELLNGSWFLAEGAANSAALGYKTYYLVSNPNPQAIGLRAYYAAENGYTIVKEHMLPARSRTTLALINEAGQGSFGTVFQSLGPAGYDVQVERSLFWGNMNGSTGASAVKSAATRWMFAEGSRGGERFSNYFLLFNPTQIQTTVTLSFFFADGSSFVYSPVGGIGAQQRLTIDANAIPELAGRDFSTVVDATVPVVAERSMFWGWNGPSLWTGGTGSLGAMSLNTRWYFAEGAAAVGYQTYYLLWNPNPTPIIVHANFHTEFHGTVPKTFTVPPHARHTVELNHEVGNVGGASAEFWSAGNFLAERSSYWGPGGTPGIEGINVVGMPGVAGEWYLPEGSTSGLFQDYLLLMNPNGQDVPVNITVYIEGAGDASQFSLARTLPASSRTTINMAEFLATVGAPAGSSFATRVGVQPNYPGIVAEHAIYWDQRPGQYWMAGSGSVGIPTNVSIVP